MIVVEVVFLAVFWSWAFAALLFLRNTVLPRLPITLTPKELGLSAETVSFHATDGVRLEGWKIPGEARKPWIIFCHGLGANRADLLDHAVGLHRAGFNLFLFDFRAHGSSEGRTTSFGWREQRDLEGALAYLGAQADVSARPYGVYGVSMGAVTTLLVAARDERLGAIAVESPYTSLDDSIRRHVSLMYPAIPKVPFVWFVLATYRLRFGVWPAQVSAVEAARRIGPRPMLIINGALDERMPVEGAQAIAEAAGAAAELWVVDGAGHLQGFAAGPEAHAGRLVKFFERHLGVLADPAGKPKQS